MGFHPPNNQFPILQCSSWLVLLTVRPPSQDRRQPWPAQFPILQAFLHLRLHSTPVAQFTHHSMYYVLSSRCHLLRMWLPMFASLNSGTLLCVLARTTLVIGRPSATLNQYLRTPSYQNHRSTTVAPSPCLVVQPGLWWGHIFEFTTSTFGLYYNTNLNILDTWDVECCTYEIV